MTRVCIIYPADPAGDVPGGIDTFIRGEINNAPDDIEYSVIGISTDTASRPVGKWMTCNLKNGEFRFLPVISHQFTDKAPLVPVTLRYLLRLNAAARSVEADVIEFHRVEPMLRFRGDPRPKTAVLHQNMQSLYDKQSDIRWASLPKLYFALEDRVVPDLASAFCVRSDAADHYRNRYPNLADSCCSNPPGPIRSNSTRSGRPTGRACGSGSLPSSGCAKKIAGSFPWAGWMRRRTRCS